jgi:hypothetical protein
MKRENAPQTKKKKKKKKFCYQLPTNKRCDVVFGISVSEFWMKIEREIEKEQNRQQRSESKK